MPKKPGRLPKDAVFYLRMEQGLKDVLEEMARNNHMSLADYMRRVLWRHVEARIDPNAVDRLPV